MDVMPRLQSLSGSFGPPPRAGMYCKHILQSVSCPCLRKAHNATFWGSTLYIIYMFGSSPGAGAPLLPNFPRCGGTIVTEANHPLRKKSIRSAYSFGLLSDPLPALLSECGRSASISHPCVRWLICWKSSTYSN